MSEPIMTEQAPIDSDRKIWLWLMGFACVVLVVFSVQAWRDIDPIVEPTPAQISIAASAEQRAALHPKVRELLEQMEAGKVSGATASDFAEALSQATKVSRGKRFQTYDFSLNGHTGYLEGHPVVYVQVQLKTGRIIRCGTVVPCY